MSESIPVQDDAEPCLQMSSKSVQPQKNSQPTSSTEDVPFFNPSECQEEKKKTKRPFACSLCTYSSDQDKHLRKHVAEKHGGMRKLGQLRYTCGDCGQKFTHITPMRIHVRKHTNERPYKCPQCDYAGKTHSSLTNHVRIHTGEKPWVCEHCGQAFTRKDGMVRHINACHTGHRPYKCKLCPYTSVTKNSLDLHVLSKHKKEKPYKCTQCDFATCYRADLSVHMRSHTGVKPYLCPHCTYASSNSSDMVKHVRRHTGDRLFKCRYCDYTSTERHTVLVHERGKHTKVRPYKCPQCSYKTAYQSHLPRHIQRIHVEGRRAYTRTRNFFKSHSKETILAMQKVKRLNSTDVDSASDLSSPIDTDAEDQNAPISPDNSTAPSPSLWVPPFPRPARAQPAAPAVTKEREHPFFNLMGECWSDGGGPDSTTDQGQNTEERLLLQDREKGIALTRDYVEKNKDANYICGYCERTFFDLDKMAAHIKRHM